MQTIGLDAAEDEPSKVSYNEGRSKIRYRNKHPSAKVAQAAVAKAIAVLEEFYAKAADATSLAQMVLSAFFSSRAVTDFRKQSPPKQTASTRERCIVLIGIFAVPSTEDGELLPLSAGPCRADHRRQVRQDWRDHLAGRSRR